jgi:tRNA-binding protein
MISRVDFNKIDLQSGTFVKSEAFEGARKSALKLWIDFGPNWGIKKSSPELIRKQEISVKNFPPNGAKLF